MKRFFLLILISFFLIPSQAFSIKSESDLSFKIQKFYDDLMDLVSYGRKQKFYEDYMDSREISFEEFSKIVDEFENKIESYKSNLISWEKSANDVYVFLRLSFKNEKKLNSFQKNIKIVLRKKDERLVLSKKELLKIFSQKRSKRK